MSNVAVCCISFAQFIKFNRERGCRNTKICRKFKFQGDLDELKLKLNGTKFTKLNGSSYGKFNS